MDIIVKTNNSYFGAGMQRELEGQRNAQRTGLAPGAVKNAEQNKLGAVNAAAVEKDADTVDISSEGRALQRLLSGRSDAAGLTVTGEEKEANNNSGLMNVLSGNEEIADNRLAYNAQGVESAAGGSDEDDAAIRIRDLQKQLTRALKNLQEARQELSEAQAANIASVKAMQQGELPDAAVSAGQQGEQELAQAQQKVAAASAEVNSVQEQLQKMLVEQAQAAKGGARPASAAVGEVWEPQGTNNYISGNW